MYFQKNEQNPQIVCPRAETKAIFAQLNHTQFICLSSFINKQDRRYSDPKARNGYTMVKQSKVPRYTILYL